MADEIDDASVNIKSDIYGTATASEAADRAVVIGCVAVLDILKIFYQWTRDRIVPVLDADDREIGWNAIPVAPQGRGWVICDASRDTKTRWRLIKYIGRTR